MLVIHCTHCQQDQVVGFGNLVSLTNTDDGPVATARCTKGHLTTTNYHRQFASLS